MDLTSAMLRYRECARHVWNVYFQPMPEGRHEFIKSLARLATRYTVRMSCSRRST